ncbi:fucolectin-like [Rhinoderma darwinii]|uniref:fucolectin-like n=1 Tax=Rhinoderma darwinii TaxID=43563 RepID=UPI003F67259D
MQNNRARWNDTERDESVTVRHLEEMKTFSPILVFVVLAGLKYETNVQSSAVDLTLKGLAFQSSSVRGQGEAHLAIDGNSNSDFLKGSCSQTSYEYQPWWTVDLRRGYLIANVTITSLLKSQTMAVTWAEVHVGESLQDYGVYNPSCSVITSLNPGTTTTFPCDGIIGRYVTVVIPGRMDELILCEVQVEALNVPDRQLGLTITSVSNSGSQNAAMMTQVFREEVKTQIRTLSWGIDNIQQRDNQTCIPMTIPGNTGG